jgi:hypothetical protein
VTDEVQQATLPEVTETAAPVESAPVETSAAPSMDDTIRETYQKLTGNHAERVRSADGKFAKAAQEVTDEAQAATPHTEEGAEEIAPPAAPAKPHDAAPNTWRKELQAEFGTLPEHVREEIHRRETDFHKGIGQYKEAASFGHAMFEDVSPHFDAMRQLGATPQAVVRDVLGTWRTLATGSPEQKRATLLQLAHGYGIPLNESFAPSNGGTPSTAQAPEIAPAVLQRLQRLESTITESQHQREQAEQAALLTQAEKFLSDPQREHMDAVFDDVLALVRGGQSLDDAYNKAIWAHPETRTKLMAKQDAERRTREAAEAAAARKAAASNVTRRGTPPVQAKAGSMDDTIRATWRRLNG